ncbi:metal ABC transporter permease [Agrococcus jenensis]|uniref:ABC-type Mn2+/Zn2+ transport system permease subunit n=1 Tax=Agrococcus jenensis TaxID=46353 RepID=A0A3N2ARW0_9MICO|nr:metal ABC transporter permease [Agrococcus jenensis]ROR65658.1 ABC-type Mn2+/Zn2+ transport system permease subunit [Agrococcus jenensis]
MMPQLDFFALAMLEVVLAGALAGIVGVLVVLRERAFFTMSLTHATFPGAVAAAMLGGSVPIGAAVAAVALIAVAVGIGRIRSQGPAVASGVMLTAGFALGALLQSLAPLAIDVESFLVGQVLAVTGADVGLTAVLLVAAAAVWALAGRHLVFSSADEAGYRRAGMRPWIPETVSLALIAGTVVAIMPVVGAILGVALIVAPAAAARLVVRDWRWMLVLAPAIGITSGVVGLLASRWLDLAAGGAIALVAALLYGAAWLVGSARDRARPTAVRATIEARTP